MEDYLRLGFLAVGLIFFITLISGVWNKRKRLAVIRHQNTNREYRISDMHAHEKIAEPCLMRSPATEHTIPQQNDLIVISILSKPDSYFASYDLMQAISSCGLQFGEMNIFHYYETNKNSKSVLFSLASATEPGEFDINRMGDFSCSGLTLFMQLKHVSDPESAFELMLDTAYKLAEDLDGELRAGHNSPLNKDALETFRERVGYFQHA